MNNDIPPLMLWKLGLGNMGKFFIGENPLPDKSVKATADMFDLKPMPDHDVTVVDTDIILSPEEMKIIQMGHIPESQEDHWFMYCTDHHIRYYRSWTGTCAFEARFHKRDGQYIIDRLKINQALCEFGVNGDEAGITLFRYLLTAEVGYDPREAWNDYLAAWQYLNEKYKSKNMDTIKRTFDAYNEAERLQLRRSTETTDYRTTPKIITRLGDNEIFVFGSNAKGHHGGGAARAAVDRFGAIWGQGDGLQGQSYAISTMEGLINTARNVNRFILFAAEHQELKFLVTPIGCGIAGYTPLQIAPLFSKALALPNVFLPRIFWEYFWQTKDCAPAAFTPDPAWSTWP